ncbi:putative CAP domain protein [Trachipleistophora hominis]|uniref:Putative CAP domain protein n=1 Tax=Trachipleistophora hominis TaxID=72359 RepID=L7K076_TRAHO|nr:putative CAP domain protein [Trachipleistophora hominis]
MLPLITIAVHTLTIYTSLLTITNEYRAQNALAPLAVHPSLTRAASQQANTMCTRKSLVHNNLSGRLAAVDFVGARIGENIARSVENDEHRVFEVWLKSEMHRDNIVGDYEFVGEGKCVDGDGYFYYVEIFGRRARDTDGKDCGDGTSCGEIGARTGISAVKYDVPEQHGNTVKYDDGNTKTKRTIRLIIDRSSSNDNHPKNDPNTPNTIGYISSYGANTGYNTNTISYSDFLVYYDQFLKNYLSSLQTKDECTIKEINEKLKSIDGQLSRLLGRGNEREVNGGNDKCSGSCGVRGGGYEPVYDDNVKNVSDDKEGDKSRDNGRNENDDNVKNVNDQNVKNVNDDKEGDKSRDNGKKENNDNAKNVNDTDINKINDKPENDNNSTSKNINKVNNRSENENKNGNKNTADEGDSNTSSPEKPKNDVRVPIVVSDKKNEKRRNVLLINLKDLLGNIPNTSIIDENTNNDKGNGEMATNTQQNKGPDNRNDDENGGNANDKGENGGNNTKNSTKSKDDQNASAKNENNGEINMGSDVKGLAEILEHLKIGKKTENSNVDPENGKESAGQSNDKHEMDDDLRFVIKIGNNGIENENEINKLISVLKKIAEGKDTPTNEGGDKNKQGELERQNEDGKNKQEELEGQNGDGKRKTEEKDNGDKNKQEELEGQNGDGKKKPEQNEDGKNKQEESDKQNGDGKRKTEEKDNGDKNKQKQAEKQNKENENDETGKELILKELISLIGKLERIRTGESAKDLKKEEQSENKPEILNWVKGLKSIIEKYNEESGDKAKNGHENERERIDDRNKNGKMSKDGDTSKDNQSKRSDKDKNDGEKTMSNSPDDSDKNKNSSMNRKETVSNSPDDGKKTKDGDETNDQNGDGNKNAARNSTGNSRPANTVKIRKRYNPFSLNQTKITTKLAELCRLLSASDKMNSFNYTNMSKLCTENENGLDDEVYGSNDQIEIGVPLYYGAQLMD